MSKTFPRLIIPLFLCFYLLKIFSIAISDEFLDCIEYNGTKLNIPTSSNVEGMVSISGISDKKNINVMVQGPINQTWYDIELLDGRFNKEIWLHEGIGKYEISIMIHEYDSTYSFGPQITVNNIWDIDPFSSPSEYIQSNNPEIINLANNITKNSLDDLDKARAIYNWIKNNIRYDMIKYRNHLNNNFDNKYGALNTLQSKKGVCFDFSTLLAALGRAANIRVKVIQGDFLYSDYTSFHAWNEVYISSENKWINIDTTFAHVYKKDYFDNSDFNVNHIKGDEF